jgi:hypothetical protein
MKVPDWIVKHRPGKPVWNAQPDWVKVTTLAVALPIWVAAAALGSKVSILDDIGFGVFAAVAVLQLVFFARALWRMED